jgi:hypothetical protein
MAQYLPPCDFARSRDAATAGRGRTRPAHRGADGRVRCECRELARRSLPRFRYLYGGRLQRRSRRALDDPTVAPGWSDLALLGHVFGSQSAVKRARVAAASPPAAPVSKRRCLSPSRLTGHFLRLGEMSDLDEPRQRPRRVRRDDPFRERAAARSHEANKTPLARWTKSAADGQTAPSTRSISGRRTRGVSSQRASGADRRAAAHEQPPRRRPDSLTP